MSRISVHPGIKATGMPYTRLGNSGLQVSRICLGMMSYGVKSWREWVLEEQESIPFVKKALELGINFFDTADVYSLGVSEEITGRALNQYAIRDEIVVATKVFAEIGPGPHQSGLSRKHIMQACDDSLRRLGMDYIDLYQIHRWDNKTPIEETMEALHDLVKSGKVRYIGASSMYAWQFAKAQAIAEKNNWTKFISMQNHYNLVYREEEREMIPLCIDQRVGIIPWSPLARGFLIGNRKLADKEKCNNENTNATAPTSGGEEGTAAEKSSRRAKNDPFAHGMYYAPEDFKIVEVVTEIAKSKNITNAQVALAWMLGKKYVCAPIIGATKMFQLEEAVAATKITLSEEETKRLEDLYVPHKILGHS